MNKKDIKGYSYGIYSGISWGFDAVLASIILGLSFFAEDKMLALYGSFLCAFLHDCFASLGLVGILAKRKQLPLLSKALKSKDALFCALGALLGGPLAMSCYYLSIERIGAPTAATITATYPLLGSILAVYVLKEKVSIWGWLGLLICVTGIIFMAYSPNSDALPINNIGLLFALISAFGWASEAVVCAYGMKSSDFISPSIALFIRETTSTLCYALVLCPLLFGSYTEVFNFTILIFADYKVIGLVILSGLIGMSSFLGWYSSIDLIGAAKALCLNVTYSFWAIVFSYILIEPTISTPVLIGSIMVIIGIIISTSKRKK